MKPLSKIIFNASALVLLFQITLSIGIELGLKMKILYVVLGCVALLLGGIGAIVPLFPSFPFLLISAFCFAKSSKKLHTWFISTKLYKNNLESYVDRKAMTLKSKIKIIVAVTIIMVLGFLMMKAIPVGQLILAIVWFLHLIYFSFKVKTI